MSNKKSNILSVSNSESTGWDPAKEHLATGFPPIQAMNSHLVFDPDEVERLRALAGRVAEIAALPVQKEKAALWTAHNDLQTTQPLVFIDPENGWNEIIRPEMLSCRDNMARVWEMHLLKQIYWFEHLKDDKVIEPVFEVHYSFSDNGWGLTLHKEGGENAGAYKIVGSITDYETDFEKLHYPEICIDFEESQRVLDLAQDIFNGILSVRRRPVWWWSLGMTVDYIMLRGIENFMCDLIVEPDYVHAVMDMMCKGINRKLDRFEREGLLALNTDGAYVGSGGFGWTNELPSWSNPPKKVRTEDMWGFFESQETSSVSPQMYGEFVFPYHMELAKRFGLNCYGCCESVTERWEYVKNIPNLRRVSMSPWADWTQIPELLENRYIASLKLSPTALSMPNMDEDDVRATVKKAIKNTRGCIPEYIMKDNNTLGNRPQNACRWVEICREEINKL
jgi:hypothetical protein